MVVGEAERNFGFALGETVVLQPFDITVVQQLVGLPEPILALDLLRYGWVLAGATLVPTSLIRI